MFNRTNIIAVFLLVFMFVINVLSVRDESLTMDELAHLPAGYSYLSQQDMRLNPEHPPLIKDLAGFPLLLIKNINFPSEAKDWKDEINGQWGFGNVFLFKSGNPADAMIFWGRIPMILLTVLLGFFVFRWTREYFGNKAGIIALFFYSFSPTFLAHGRLITTDVGAAFGVFFATYYFLKFLKDSSKRNLIVAGIALGVAELLKFSLILLLPFFGILIFLWAINPVRKGRALGQTTPSMKLSEGVNPVRKSRDLGQITPFMELSNGVKNFFRFLGFYILILAIGYALLWGVYLFHTWNYPPEKQFSDTKATLASFGNRPLAEIVIWMSDKPILKGAAQYLLGLFMVLQRTSGGNTGYFLGEISAAGWKTYFPFVYLTKEPLTFHILWITGLLSLAWLIKKHFWQNAAKRTLNWMKNHFVELSSLIFIAIYWITSLKSNLNIGVRHLLPTFPFVIMLASGVIGKHWLKQPRLLLKTAIIAALVVWQGLSILFVYPYFISYYNELVGGPKNGYLYAVDSNYDWGQDLKRLAKWADENKIDKIYIDYFGGADVKYYLKDKYLSWWGSRNPEELPDGSYLAISVSFLQGGRGKPAEGYNNPTGFYNWLNSYAPIARIGYSIFVYKIP